MNAKKATIKAQDQNADLKISITLTPRGKSLDKRGVRKFVAMREILFVLASETYLTVEEE